MKLSKARTDQIAKKLWTASLRIPKKHVDTDWMTLDKSARNFWWEMVRLVYSELQSEGVDRSLAMRKEFGSLYGRQQRVQPAKSCSIVDGKKVCQ
jgi:hypothetical protein